MNKRFRSLIPALAVAASLCWQAPAMADPWSHGQNGPPHDQNWRDDRPGRADRPNGQDMRFRGQNPNDDRGRGAPGPYYAGNGSRGDPRYPGNPGYPGRSDHDGDRDHDWDRDHGGDRDHDGDRDRYGRYPARYPAYYPNYRPYPAYGGYYGPRYYGYYGPRYYGYAAPVVYPTYYPAPVAYGPVSYGGYGGGGYGCTADATLGVAGAVTGAIVGNNSAAPRNRGVGTVVGAVAGGIIGTAIGGAIDAAHCIGR